jgi:hypothetical protein
MTDKYAHAIALELREINKILQVLVSNMKKTTSQFTKEPCDCPECQKKELTLMDLQIGSSGSTPPNQSEK